MPFLENHNKINTIYFFDTSNVKKYDKFINYGVAMQVTAKVTIQNSTYEAWYDFFLSYADRRGEFVQNEQVEKISLNEAKVSFEITDLEGLTELSASKEIIEKEAEMGVTTEIV